MRKYQTIFILTLWLFFVFNFYLNTTSSNLNPKVYLKDLNRSVPSFKELLSVPVEKIYKNDYKLWDMKISKLLEDRDKKALKKDEDILKKSQIDKPKEQNLNVKYRTICVEKKCWQFVGVMTVGGIKTLTLLNKEDKNRFQIFKIGDELLPKVIIKDIKGESMILLNKEKNKRIVLKLFDVDVSEYLPKRTKEKNE